MSPVSSAQTSDAGRAMVQVCEYGEGAEAKKGLVDGVKGRLLLIMRMGPASGIYPFSTSA